MTRETEVLPVVGIRFLALSAVLRCASNVEAALTTNRWNTVSSGKWEIGTNWSAGAPTNSNAANFITNAASKIVTIDSTTTNAANVATLSISNLVLSAPADTTNTLALTDAGTITPLHILKHFGINGGGALLITNSALSIEGASSGDFSIDGGVMLSAGASVVATNTGASTIIGNTFLQTGSLTMNGGSALVRDFTLGGFANARGVVWMTSGLLRVFGTFDIGEDGIGQFALSNGTVRGDVVVGHNSTGQGTWAIAGGTSTLFSLIIGELVPDAHGTVSMTGGELTVTNLPASAIFVGEGGAAEMTLSNGTVLATTCFVANNPGSHGTLTIAGGTNTILGRLLVGNQANSTGAVWVTGGRLEINDSSTLATAIGSLGVGQMSVSNGRWRARNVVVGGTLSVASGTSSVLSNLALGGVTCSVTGIINITGGELNVTNALTNAMLHVRSGTLTLSAGTLQVDRFVMTNSCGFFTHTGGTLIYGTAVLDPACDDDGDGILNGYEQSHGLDPLNPADASPDSDGNGLTNLQEFQAGTDATNSASFFGITAIVKTNIDIRVAWMTGPGKTNALERSPGTANGSYSNNFAAIFTVTNTVGSTTNYFDVGAATNFPAFYYRVRLVP